MALSDDINNDLRRYAALQAEVNAGLDSYLKKVEELKKLNKSIETATSNKKKLEQELVNLTARGVSNTSEEYKLAEAKIAVLDKQLKKIKLSRDLTKEAIKDAKLLNMTLGQAGASFAAGTAKAVGNIGKIPSLIGSFAGKFKDMFEMDKSIRIAARDMGIMGKSSEAFRRNITETSLDTIGFGAGIKELAELQATYSEAIGRNVMMNEGALKSVSAMANATQLGIEGAAQMTAEFESQGMSAEKTASFVEDTLNSSSKMGLNSAKVIKNIAGNIKMLNRYRFKDGAKGLAEMAKTVSKLGVDMNFATNMADKLFDIEPAIEMSAQLQVMGGAWSRLADPFRLMYMARNDVKGLTEEIANAAKESMSFAKDGSIETTAMEMHRLRIVAQQTGLEYDDLLEAGKKAFKLGQIKAKVVGVDDDTKEFIANTAEFKDGKATITIDGEPKLISMLTNADKNRLKEMVKEKKNIEERAKAAQSFDEKIGNLINMVKIAMMPILEGITGVLEPLVNDLTGEKGKGFREELKNLGKWLASFAIKGAEWFKGLAELAVQLGPTGIFATWLTGKAVLFLFEKANWIANGFALAQGFLGGTRGGGLGSVLGQGFARTAGPLMATAAAGVGGGMLGKWLGKKATESSGRKSTEAGDMWGTTGAVIGGLAGLALAPFTGGASLALTAAAVGGGALAGGFAGKYFGDMGTQDEPTMTEPGDDVYLPKLKNKLPQSHSRGRALLQGGEIKPINNKDELLAMKPGGVVDKTLNSINNNNNNSMKIEFDEIKITGEIKIMLPDGTNIGRELLKNPEFKTSITRVVTSQLDKNVNGGKIKP